MYQLAQGKVAAQFYLNSTKNSMLSGFTRINQQQSKNRTKECFSMRQYDKGLTNGKVGEISS